MKFTKYSSIENSYREKFIDKILMELPSDTKYVVTEKIHGCFKHDTKITMVDGSYRTIQELVESKYSGDILGADEEGNLVPTRVVNWYENGVSNEWLKISFQSYGGRGGRNRVLTCTPNHKFFSGGAYVSAEQLSIGDSVEYTYDGISLSFFQEQVLIGKMLGDGSLGRSAVSFGHKEDNEDYVDFTLKCLGSIAGNRQKNMVSGYGTVMCRGRSISSPNIAKLFSDWDKGSGKVPKIRLTPISLLFWYLDDGSINLNDNQRPRASFATCGFSKESCDNLVSSLNSIGLEATVTGEDGRLRTILSSESTDLLFSLICNLVPESMRYKLPSHYRVEGSGKGLLMKAGHDSKMLKSHAVVTNIQKLNTELLKYDLETTTHNYFANNIHVHNSNYAFYSDGKEVVPAKRSSLLTEYSSFFNHSTVFNKYKDKVLEMHRTLWPDVELLRVVGELYGDGVQRGVHYSEQQDFVAFDIFKDGLPINHFSFAAACDVFGIPVVPEIDCGITLEEALNVANLFDSVLGGKENNSCEGVVIKPIYPQFLSNGSRVILKNKNDKFSENSGKKRISKEIVFTEEEKEFAETFLGYINENRINSVISKLGNVTQKDFGKLLGLTIQDALEDYEKDLGSINKDVWHKVRKKINKSASVEVRKLFLKTL